MCRRRQTRTFHAAAQIVAPIKGSQDQINDFLIKSVRKTSRDIKLDDLPPSRSGSVKQRGIIHFSAGDPNFSRACGGQTPIFTLLKRLKSYFFACLWHAGQICMAPSQIFMTPYSNLHDTLPNLHDPSQIWMIPTEISMTPCPNLHDPLTISS